MKPLTREEFDRLREGAAACLQTQGNIIVVPGEAILGIESLARCAAGPGRTFLNLAAGPYGEDFGRWLRECGSDVAEIAVPWNETITADEVREAVRKYRPDVISYVYAEAVTGGRLPAEEIQAAAREEGVFTLVDAVSSVGADPFLMDEWGVDFVSMGMQKALLGSNGVSFLGISERGMEWLCSNPAAPRHSILSIPEERDRQQREIPPALSVLEARDALCAFEKIEAAGGIRTLTERHRGTACYVRRSVRELGYELFQKEESFCTDLNTAVVLPEDQREFAGAGILARGDLALSGKVLRINHYGEHCGKKDAEEALKTLELLRK